MTFIVLLDIFFPAGKARHLFKSISSHVAWKDTPLENNAKFPQMHAVQKYVTVYNLPY